MHVDTLFAHLGLDAQVYPRFPFAVQVLHFQSGTGGQDVRLQSHLHGCGIFLAVLHHSVELHARAVLQDARADGVEEQLPQLQVTHFRPSRHTAARVGLQVYKGRCESKSLHAGNVVERIVLSGIQIQPHDGQESLQLLLVQLMLRHLA